MIVVTKSKCNDLLWIGCSSPVITIAMLMIITQFSASSCAPIQSAPAATGVTVNISESSLTGVLLTVPSLQVAQLSPRV